MKKILKFAFVIAILGMTTPMITACEDEGGFEEMGEGIDETGDEFNEFGNEGFQEEGLGDEGIE